MATLVQAVRMALHYGETNLGVTDIFGEDVGPPLGGVFTATQGLKPPGTRHSTSAASSAPRWALPTLAARPVAEIQILRLRLQHDRPAQGGRQSALGRAAGNFELPMVVMMPVGLRHPRQPVPSHSFESWASRCAAGKSSCPATPSMLTDFCCRPLSIPIPWMVLLPKALLRVRGEQKIPGEPEDERRELKSRIDAPVGDRSSWQPRWPDVNEPYYVKIGEATHVREGDTATVISYGRTLSVVRSGTPMSCGRRRT